MDGSRRRAWPGSRMDVDGSRWMWMEEDWRKMNQGWMWMDQDERRRGFGWKKTGWIKM